MDHLDHPGWSPPTPPLVARLCADGRAARQIFEHATTAVELADLDGRLLETNPAARRFLGCEEEELRGRHFTAHTHPDDRAAGLALYGELCAGRREWYRREKRYLRADRRIVWGLLTAALVRDPAGRPWHTMHLVEDITARKVAEAALRREREFNAAILDTSDSLIVFLDRAGRIVRFNRACERATGYTFAEVRGQLFWTIFLTPDELGRVMGVFANFCAGRFPNEHVNHWRTRRGDLRLIAWSNTALLDAAGEVEEIVATGTDITERTRAEAAVRRFEAGLTPMERQILPLLAQRELTYRQIGARFGITAETVRKHMQGIAEKLHVDGNRDAVVIAARERGLL